MKYRLTAGTVLVAIITGGICLCTEEAGNWYCDAVQAISYSNFGTPGIFQKVTTMANGKCSSTPQSYSGGMSPMDEEVSWHFRGPMHLKQFAFYTTRTIPTKRGVESMPLRRHHDHQLKHRHIADIGGAKKRCDSNPMITATINGDVVSWSNPYACATSVPANNRVAANIPITSVVTAATSATIHSLNPMPTLSASTGVWNRQAYYNAEDGTADGLVFLNHMGGQGSGVFDYTWGNSLSYAAPDAKSGSASPQILDDVLLDDNVEIVMMSNKSCAGNDCGTIRPGTVAYHGFEGASKLFLLEFDMPLSGKKGFNADTPAAWILNANIPRTMQYGQAECSCWTSGCGEWDIFEVLDSGNTKCKSTWHGLKPMGDSNWFPRPIDATQKAAVVFDGDASVGHIILLPADTTFDSTIDISTVIGYLSSITNPAKSVKVALPS